MLGRIWSLVWKEALQLWRYKLVLIFVLVFPVWNLWSVANMVSQGIMHIPTAICDEDHSQASRRLATILDNSRGFEVAYQVSSRAELEQLLKYGTVKVGLVIPPNFESDAQENGASVQVLLDGSETTTALVAQAYLEGLAFEYIRWLLGISPAQAAALDQLAQNEPRVRVWFNEELRREVFQLPAEMAGGVAILAVLLPAVTIIREREAGTLEQLLVAPMRSVELITGKSLLTLLITLLVFGETLALNVLYFRIPLRGSLALLVVLTGYYIFIEMGWGLLISAVARTQGQGFVGAFVVVILEVILSGQVLPVEYMPWLAQAASYLMPNRHYNTIVRGIMLKGYTLGDLWPEVVILGLIGVMLYALVLHRLRKGLE
ncbi:MAG: ABC transporter permease [Anaerolineales bacterium]|nr:ABC transporter permease [Anaerolineales bacterium]